MQRGNSTALKGTGYSGSKVALLVHTVLLCELGGKTQRASKRPYGAGGVFENCVEVVLDSNSMISLF
jgi:hypothetical protein